MATADSLRRRVSGWPQSRMMQPGQMMRFWGALDETPGSAWSSPQMASDTPCRPAAPVLVDHKHMPLLLAVQRLRRMVFRAAHGPVAAATQVLGAKPHACLRLGRA